MAVVLVDPTGVMPSSQREGPAKLQTLKGKRVGFIFNQHAIGKDFWRGLEREVEKNFAPIAIDRVYKDNTWAPAAPTDVERLIRETDYVLVGVGA